MSSHLDVYPEVMSLSIPPSWGHVSTISHDPDFFLNADTHKRLSKCTNNSGCYSCNIKLIFLFFSYKQLLPDKKITVGNI